MAGSEYPKPNGIVVNMDLYIDLHYSVVDSLNKEEW